MRGDGLKDMTPQECPLHGGSHTQRCEVAPQMPLREQSRSEMHRFRTGVGLGDGGGDGGAGTGGGAGPLLPGKHAVI